MALLTFFGVEFGVSDFFDIAGLTLLFYFLFLFISDKRALKLVLGVLVITGIALAASVFELQGIGFILGNIFQVGIIALVIIFQPEIRSVLEKVGDQPIKGLKNITEQKDTVSAKKMVKSVVAAVGDLAANKTGALIVFERNTKLGDVMKTGVTINADPSPALIKNIFYNKAPLHDGAMVISNYTIAAAGCFLTNTKRLDIPEELGSRHRAAIGGTEESDAIIVVVSEETGMISIARGGDLKRGYTRESLEKELTLEFCSQPQKNVKTLGDIKSLTKDKKKHDSDNDR